MTDENNKLSQVKTHDAEAEEETEIMRSTENNEGNQQTDDAAAESAAAEVASSDE